MWLEIVVGELIGESVFGDSEEETAVNGRESGVFENLDWKRWTVG